jgi:hypothetical protein
MIHKSRIVPGHHSSSFIMRGHPSCARVRARAYECTRFMYYTCSHRMYYVTCVMFVCWYNTVPLGDRSRDASSVNCTKNAVRAIGLIRFGEFISLNVRQNASAPDRENFSWSNHLRSRSSLHACCRLTLKSGPAVSGKRLTNRTQVVALPNVYVARVKYRSKIRCTVGTPSHESRHFSCKIRAR